MVFIEATRSIFDERLDMIWKLREARKKEGNTSHPRNNKTLILNKTNFINIVLLSK
jgi:hypothetical protein